MSPETIVTRFRDAGVDVRVRASEQPNALLGRVTTIGPPASGPERERVVREYGEFSIGVLHDLSPELRELLVHDEQPDTNGVFWERQFPEDDDAEPYWTARKFYGNVQLLWWSAKRAADERWRALDEIMRRTTADD